MTFSLPFGKPWDGNLTNKDSPAYKSLKQEVESKVMAAFTGCPGFRFCEVTNFCQFTGTNGCGVLRAKTAGMTTQAMYNTSFSPEVVFENKTQDVIVFISTNATASLMAANISGSPVDPSLNVTMQTELNVQAETFAVHPCQKFITDICDPCYRCEKSAAIDKACELICSPADHKSCELSDPETPWVSNCTCESSYLAIGSGCVNQDIVIGGSVSIGTAIIIGLVIAVIILYRRSSSNKKNGSSERKTLGFKDRDYEGNAAADADNAGLAADDKEATEQRDQQPAGPFAAAATVAEAAVSAFVEVAEVQQRLQERVAQSLQQQLIDLIPAPDYDSGPPTTFSTFAPQLQYVDTTRDYSIRRPNVGYGSPGFGSAYQQPQYPYHH
jgi:hypothetical protein